MSQGQLRKPYQTKERQVGDFKLFHVVCKDRIETPYDNNMNPTAVFAVQILKRTLVKIYTYGFSITT